MCRPVVVPVKHEDTVQVAGASTIGSSRSDGQRVCRLQVGSYQPAPMDPGLCTSGGWRWLAVVGVAGACQRRKCRLRTRRHADQSPACNKHQCC